MAVSKQVDYAFGTVVSDVWLDRIQEINAPLAWNTGLRISGTSVVMTASTDSGAAAIVIEGKMRYVEGSLSVPFTGKPSGDYGIWATTSNNDNLTAFALEAVLVPSAPSAERSRRVGQVTWNGTALSNLLQFAGYSTHAHMHRPGQDPLPDASVTAGMLAGDQMIKAADGAVGGPSYSFTSAPNYGMYKTGTDLAFGTAGTTRLLAGSAGLRATVQYETTANTGYLHRGGSSGTAQSFAARATSDSQYRIEIMNDGTVRWGGGTAAFDTNMGRLGTGHLHVPQHFSTGTLAVGSSTPVIPGYPLKVGETLHIGPTKLETIDINYIMEMSFGNDLIIQDESGGGGTDLIVRGAIYHGAGVFSLSDATLKRLHNEPDPSDSLNRIRALKVHTWSWRSDEEKKERIGPMAQDYHRIFETGVSVSPKEDVPLSYPLDDLVGHVVLAIQELANRVENLELEKS